MEKKKRSYSLGNPIVFSALLNQPSLSADFLNSTGEFNIKEENIKSEITKFYEGVDLKVADLDVLLKIVPNEKDLVNVKEKVIEYVNIESQNRKPNYDMMGRLVYYFSKLVCKSEPRGKGYQNNKCTVVAVFNFTMFNDKRCMRKFSFKDEENNVIKNYSIIVIELTKSEYCNNILLKKWLDIFKLKDLENAEEESDIMKKVKDEIRKLSNDELFQLRLDFYEAHEEEREYELEIAKEEAREQGLEEGRTEGLAQGLAAGRAEGRAEGHAEGHAEGKAEGHAEGELMAKIEMAKRMKDSGMSLDMIIKFTDLNKEQIEKI